jgi:hypothetical protein
MHSGTRYMDHESVLVNVSGHKLLLCAHFYKYFDNSYTFVKVSPLGLQLKLTVSFLSSSSHIIQRILLLTVIFLAYTEDYAS